MAKITFSAARRRPHHEFDVYYGSGDASDAKVMTMRRDPEGAQFFWPSWSLATHAETAVVDELCKWSPDKVVSGGRHPQCYAKHVKAAVKRALERLDDPEWDHTPAGEPPVELQPEQARQLQNAPRQADDRGGPCVETALESLTGMDRAVFRWDLDMGRRGSTYRDIATVLKRMKATVYQASNHRQIGTRYLQSDLKRLHRRGAPKITLGKLFRSKRLTPGLWYVSVTGHGTAVEVTPEGHWYVVDTGCRVRTRWLPIRNNGTSPMMGVGKHVKYYARIGRNAARRYWADLPKGAREELAYFTPA